MTSLPAMLAWLDSIPGTPDPDNSVFLFYAGVGFIAELLAWMVGYALGILFRAPVLAGAVLTLGVGLLPAFLGFDPPVTVCTVILSGLVIAMGWGLHNRVRELKNKPPDSE